MDHKYKLEITVLGGQIIEVEVINKLALKEFIEMQSDMLSNKKGTLVFEIANVTHQIAVDKIVLITTEEI